MATVGDACQNYSRTTFNDYLRCENTRFGSSPRAAGARDKYLSFHSSGGLGRQLVPEHVHLGHGGLCLMRLLVQLLAQ